MAVGLSAAAGMEGADASGSRAAADPGPPDLFQGALYAGESHLRKREWFHAARSFARASRLAEEPGDRELARALLHLAAAGYKDVTGDARSASRQRDHAVRRLAPFRPHARRLDLEALVALVEARTEA